MEYDNNSDCHGADIIGSDGENLWMGTVNAWSILGDPDTSGCDHEGNPDGSEDGPPHPPATPTYFEVTGRCGNLDYQGYFVASNEARVRQFVEGIGVQEVKFLEVVVLKAPVDLDPAGFLFVDDEEVALLLGTLCLTKPVSEQETYPHGPKR